VYSGKDEVFSFTGCQIANRNKPGAGAHQPDCVMFYALC